jgi:hypothetical protein
VACGLTGCACRQMRPRASESSADLLFRSAAFQTRRAKSRRPWKAGLRYPLASPSRVSIRAARAPAWAGEMRRVAASKSILPPSVIRSPSKSAPSCAAVAFASRLTRAKNLLWAKLVNALGIVLREGFQEALLPDNYCRSHQSRSGETVGLANSIAFKLLLYHP